MVIHSSGGVKAKAIIVQLAIVAGLIAYLKVYIPRVRKERAVSEAQQREKKIESLFQSMAVEDPSREVALPSDGGKKLVHPQKLRSLATVEDVEQALGAADVRSGDFRGGLHLTWIGTDHKLEAAFNGDRLYCLRMEDRQTGHGALVFESSLNWVPF
jgi:hypothetical protein